MADREIDSKETADEQNHKDSTSNNEIQSSGVTFWLLYTTIVCVVGSSFQFGYNLAVINAPEEVIKAYFRSCGTFTDFEWAVSVAIFAVGGMSGALTGPAAANIFGRKKTLWFNNFLAILGGLMMSLSRVASTPEILSLGRLVIGLNCGINTVVVPTYLSEIAPIHLRGALGTLNQFGIVSGILISQILGIKKILGNESGWPYLLGLPIAPAILQLFALYVCPMSPRYLLLKLQNEEQARQALYRLRGTTYISADIAEMEVEQEKERGLEKVSVFQLFTRKDLRMPLLICVVLQMSQQFSGINGVFYYSTSIFNMVGVKNSDAATCGVGVVSVVMTAIVVKMVEIKGRRTLLLWGLGGMVIFYTVMTISFALQHKVTWFSYVSVVATLILIVFFQFGPGPIPWFITAELFAQGSRDAAVSVAGTVNWLGSFVVGLTFPSLQKSLYPYTFVLFIVLVSIFWLFTWFVVPETKGRAIEDIAEGFRNKSQKDSAPLTNGDSSHL